MTTPLSRRPEPGDGFPQAVSAGPAAAEYLLPATWRGVAAQAAAALSMLTGLWVAISPLFLTLAHVADIPLLTLAHVGTNANVADAIAGLVTAGVGVFALSSPRGFPGLQFTSLVLGVWVLISTFILAAKFSIAAPMYWSNSWSGGLLIVLALAGLATLRPSTR